MFTECSAKSFGEEQFGYQPLNEGALRFGSFNTGGTGDDKTATGLLWY
jgi:hypothetical protein